MTITYRGSTNVPHSYFLEEKDVLQFDAAFFKRSRRPRRLQGPASLLSRLAAHNSPASVTLSGDVDAITHSTRNFDGREEIRAVPEGRYSLSLASSFALW